MIYLLYIPKLIRVATIGTGMCSDPVLAVKTCNHSITKIINILTFFPAAMSDLSSGHFLDWVSHTVRKLFQSIAEESRTKKEKTAGISLENISDVRIMFHWQAPFFYWELSSGLGCDCELRYHWKTLSWRDVLQSSFFWLCGKFGRWVGVIS